ncbi:hypothetical protein CXF85_21995 [Colwellia sp. 75C3]|uniref:translocation/assembly module TamB domain-containing protein n=1 Tax=Colwellia sp. 75C3 TaxID=888425 RepID=UPI000C32403D|nr:translocation/assembly module TamB domain-containing protein [Colwellia sp. 75C3]PKG80783.1 hypothetical protein CXF85_21995 [Colwellia sp. 75C3]
MIWRRLTFKVIKWLTLLLFLCTILLTTPWGTRVTVSLLNNIDGINFDYKAGALVRDIELHSFQLSLKNLNIHVKDVSTKIDFSCSWRKTLCIDTLKVASFSLTYFSDNNDKKSTDKAKKVNDGSLFVMPFAIEAQAVDISKSLLIINQTIVDIEQFTAKVVINNSQFNILRPSAKRLSISVESNKQANSKTITTTASKSISKNSVKATGNAVYSLFSNLPEVNLPISLNIQQLLVDELRIVDPEKKNNNSLIKGQQWPYQQSQLSGTWVKSEVDITNFSTSTVNYAINHLALKTQLIPPYKINTRLKVELHKISRWPEASDSTIELSLQGAFDDLTANVTSKGSLVLSSQGHVNLSHPQLPFKLQLSADKLPLPSSLAQYAKPSSLSLDMSGDLVQQTINLRSHLNSYGYRNAQLDLSARHQQGLITVNELVFNEKDSNNQLNLHGNIDFQSKATSWQLFADSSGFTLPKINLKALVSPKSTDINKDINTRTKAEKNTEALAKDIETLLPDVINGRFLGRIASTGTWSASQWSLSVNDTDVSGTLNNNPFIIQGDIAVNQSGYFSSGDLQQGELLIVFDKDQLTLQTFDDNNWHVNGKLDIANISRWYTPASGSFISAFTISGNKQDPIITVDTKFNNLQWQQFYSPLFSVAGSYQPFNAHKTKLTVKNKRLDITDKSDTLTIEDITLDFSGDLYQHQLQLDWQGIITGHLMLSGQWHEALNHWQSTIEHSVLTYQQETLRNDDTFSINFDVDKQQLLIDKHCWLAKGLEICLPVNTWAGESGDVTLTLNLDLALMDEFILPKEVQLKSKISGDIKAQWSPTQAISAMAYFDFSSGNIKVNDEFNEQQVSQWHQGTFSFAVNETHLTSKFQLQDVQEKVLIKTNSTITFVDDFLIDAQIELNQFNLEPFQSIISNVVSLQGHLSAMLTVNGTIKEPLINGNLALDSGELLLSQNPNKLENISAELQIKNNQAKILGDLCIKENRATLYGQLAWQDFFTMDIDLNAEHLPLVFPPQLLMEISPKLNFSLKDKALKITGNLDVLKGTYNIEKLPEGMINLSDDVIIIDQQGKKVFKEQSGFDIETNVRINIGKKFKISGQGLESNLFGQLQVSQQQNKPLQLFGSIQSDQGTYKAYGQKLTIDKGELSFNGPITNPYFNLRAGRHIKAEDIEVGLKITGLADSLDIQLFSTPNMESPEILSYLARGRGLDSGGGSSTAAASMLIGFGVTNSVGLFDRLEEIPFINNIAVDTEGEGDTTQAIISGYIGNRVYLKYGIGVYEPINELTVRLYLLNRLWLEIVSGIEQSSDIYYSFDIE